MDALKVAEFIISYYRTIGITNYKLQKLLYYTQGFHLAIRDDLLFEDPIIACSTGTRIDRVHKVYSKFRFDNIPCYKILELDLNNESHKIIHDVCLIFESCYAGVIEELIMSEEPWIKARGDRGIYDVGVKMNVEDMQDFFAKEYLKL